MNYARVIGCGGYLPERVMPNSELEDLVDTSELDPDAYRDQASYCPEDQTTSEMACNTALGSH